MIPNELAELTAELKRDHEILLYPKREWVRQQKTKDGQDILDCLIIGGGQSGLGVAYGLSLEKVTNILVVDENPVGHEGPWSRFARMPHLRTPKYLTGLDFGNPHLTFRAFYVAKYGQSAYDSLPFIPTQSWSDYLMWYRTTLAIPVMNETRAGAIRYSHADNCFSITYLRPAKESQLFARTVVLANGIDGCGSWQSPAIITENLPRDRYAHTCEAIDFASLKNARIGVLGAGASAFDNAIMALNASASSLHLFSRRNRLPHINPYRWAEFVGFLKHHADLDEVMRWRFIAQIIEMGQLPPKATIERALAHDNFHIETGQTWLDVSFSQDEIHVVTESGKFQFDFVIVGTGFSTDLQRRPELSLLCQHIARFSDRIKHSLQHTNEDLARHPYLGPYFELQEKTAGCAPYLSSIFCFNFGSLLATGLGGGSISGLKYGLPRVVAGVTRALFVGDDEHYLKELMNYETPEYEPVAAL